MMNEVVPLLAALTMGGRGPLRTLAGAQAPRGVLEGGEGSRRGCGKRYAACTEGAGKADALQRRLSPQSIHTHSRYKDSVQSLAQGHLVSRSRGPQKPTCKDS